MFIEYDKIKHQTVEQAIGDILKVKGRIFKDITIKDLSIGGDFNSQCIFSVDKKAIFGNGLYVVTIPSEKWYYVGQTPNNFFDRLNAQTSSKYREFWGWNALMQFIADKLKKDKKTKLPEVRDWVMKNAEIRLINVPVDFKRFIKFENRIMAGMNLYSTYTPLNSAVPKLPNPTLKIIEHLK